MTSVAFFASEDFAYYPLTSYSMPGPPSSDSDFSLAGAPESSPQAQPTYPVPPHVGRALELSWAQWISSHYGDLYPSAVAARIEALLSVPGSSVLDIGSGLSTLWLSGLAERFPNASCIGMDSTTERDPVTHSNLILHTYDWSTGLPYPDASFNLVNSAFITWWVSTTYTYPSVLSEVARVLAPGGVFLLSEPCQQLSLDDGTEMAERYPALARFIAIHDELATLRASPLSTSYDFEALLEDTGAFSQVISRSVTAHLGPRGYDPLADQAGAAALSTIRCTYRSWLPIMAGYSIKQAFDLERRLDEELDWIESGAWGEGGGVSAVITCCIGVK